MDVWIRECPSIYLQGSQTSGVPYHQTAKEQSLWRLLPSRNQHTHTYLCFIHYLILLAFVLFFPSSPMRTSQQSTSSTIILGSVLGYPVPPLFSAGFHARYQLARYL